MAHNIVCCETRYVAINVRGDNAKCMTVFCIGLGAQGRATLDIKHRFIVSVISAYFRYHALVNSQLRILHF